MTPPAGRGAGTTRRGCALFQALEVPLGHPVAISCGQLEMGDWNQS